MATIEETIHALASLAPNGISGVCFNEPVEWHLADYEYDCGQILVLTTGTASVRSPSGNWILPTDRYMYIPAHIVHSVDTAGLVTGLMLYVASGFKERLPDRIATFQGSRLLLEVMRRLIDLVKDDVGNETQTKQSLLLVLVDEIQRSLDSPLQMQMPVDNRLKRMALDVLNNPTDDRSLREWASQLGLSSRTLLRRFKDETGMTVSQWRQHAKVLYAERKLKEGASVKEAAAAVGYNSVSSFIKLFIRLKGTTPGSWIAPQAANLGRMFNSKR